MTRSSLFSLLAALALPFGLVACPDDGEGDEEPTPDVPAYDFEDAGPWFECPSEDPPEGAVVVPILEDVEQSFGGENLRDVEADVTLPGGPWKQVGLRFELSCPDGGECDFWDRAGSLQVGLNPPGSEEQEWVEVLRHVTPYHRGMCHYVDVTPLAGVLAGDRTFRSHIDTWVGPGHAQGDGWIVDAELVYIPGEPETEVEVVNVWGHRTVNVGNPVAPDDVATLIEPVSVEIPADARRVLAHITTTGHGFGFTANCAEFCTMRHDLYVDGERFEWDGWRADCEDNPVSPQDGTWRFPRNGWCPGAVSLGGLVDVTDAVTPGQSAEIDFDIRTRTGGAYDNVSTQDGTPFTRFSVRLYAEVE